MSIHASFVLNVTDLGAERAFYRDVVGLGGVAAQREQESPQGLLLSRCQRDELFAGHPFCPAFRSASSFAQVFLPTKYTMKKARPTASRMAQGIT